MHSTPPHTKWVSFVASQLLGDGYLEGNMINWCHENAQRDYVIWKSQIARGMGMDASLRMDCPYTGSLGSYVRHFGKCRIPDKRLKNISAPELVNHLDALGLLLWWLDDGCLSIHYKRNGMSVSRFGYLCTETFDLATNNAISKALNLRFGIETKVHVDKGGMLGPNRTYYRLYLNATAMRQLIDIVRPHIQHVPKCLLYKLNMQYVPNRLSSSVGYAEMYNFM